MRWISALLLIVGLSAAGENAQQHFRRALECTANKQITKARRHYLAVLHADPRHRAARRALRGGGRPLANDALKLLWNRDASRRALGLLVIDLLAPGERARAFEIASRNRRVDVRLHAVRALTDPRALARAAVRDSSGGVRAAAIASLRRARVARPSRYLLGALRAGDAVVRLRAAEALGTLGDEAAVGPLVARLFVTGGSGQQVYIAQTNQIGFVQDFDVEVAATAFIADPSIGVVQDGVAFSFRALGHSGTRDIYEKRAVVGALRKLTGQDLETAKEWLAYVRRPARPPA